MSELIKTKYGHEFDAPTENDWVDGDIFTKKNCKNCGILAKLPKYDHDSIVFYQKGSDYKREKAEPNCTKRVMSNLHGHTPKPESVKIKPAAPAKQDTADFISEKAVDTKSDLQSRSTTRSKHRFVLVAEGEQNYIADAKYRVLKCQDCECYTREYGVGYRSYHLPNMKQVSKSPDCSTFKGEYVENLIKELAIPKTRKAYKKRQPKLDPEIVQEAYRVLDENGDTSKEINDSTTSVVIVNHEDVPAISFINQLSPESKLSPMEAVTRDSVIIIQVMYEEMVKSGMYTKGRNMAGSFLYSQGYKTLVDELNKKTKVT